MSQHLLPPLPHEGQHETLLEPQLETLSQIGCERTSTMTGSGETFAWFGDSSEIDLRIAPSPDDEQHGLGDPVHTKTLPDGVRFPEVPPALYKARIYDRLAGCPDRSQQHSDKNIASHEPVSLDNMSWPTNNDTALPPLLRCDSREARCDYVPDTSSDQQCIFCPPDTDYESPCEAPTDSIDEPSRKTLVRFADFHTILYTPPLPTPPPHLTFQSTFSSAPSRHKPYGPRIPPWGSSENLDRERRLRTDIRGLEDTLDERFDTRERLRREDEVKNAKRRTEGEELRELVLGIYPEMEVEQRDRACCVCVVM